jgi:hypothetical protein
MFDAAEVHSLILIMLLQRSGHVGKKLVGELSPATAQSLYRRHRMEAHTRVRGSRSKARIWHSGMSGKSLR